MESQLEKHFQLVEKPQHDRVGSVRYILSGLLATNCFLLYAMRLTLSVSITAMVNSTNANNEPISNTTCRDPHFVVNETVTEPATFKEGDFNWTQNEQSMITYAFFVGYLLSQIPGGYLAQSYSMTWAVGVGTGVTSILTCATSVAAKFSLYAFLGLRFFEGLFEGLITPCIYVFVTKWIPLQEQGLLLNLIVSGCSLGTVLTLPISAMLCDSPLGWPAAFYVFGSYGIVASVFWFILAADGPEYHSWISPAERDYIVNNRPASTQRSPKFVPWRSMLTSPVVILLTVESFSRTLNFYMILTELPSYLKAIFGIDIVKNGFISGAMNAGSAISLVICGWAADRMIAKGVVSKNVVRKTCVAITGIVPSLCLAAIPLVGCDYEAILALILLNCICIGFTGGGDSLLPLDIAPKFAGTLQGIVGSISHIAGVLAPLFVGVMTTNHNTLHQWNLVFVSIAIAAAVGSISFVVFGSTSEQDWARDRHTKYDDTTVLCDD